MLLGAVGLPHDRLRSLIERDAALLLGEAGAVLVLLERDALEEQGRAIEMNVNECELPERRRDLLLLDSKGATLLQATEEAAAEGDVVNEGAVDTDNTVLLVVRDKLAGGCGEDARFMCRRMERGVGHKVQRGLRGCGAKYRPNKASGQKAKEIVDLLIVVRIFSKLFLLCMSVMDELVDLGKLLRLRELMAILDEDTVHVAVWRRGDPPQEVLLGLGGVVEIDPLRVVALVLGTLGVDDLLDDLLGSLGVRENGRERK